MDRVRDREIEQVQEINHHFYYWPSTRLLPESNLCVLVQVQEEMVRGDSAKGQIDIEGPGADKRQSKR